MSARPTPQAVGLQPLLVRCRALEPYLGVAVGGYIYRRPANTTGGAALFGEAGLRYRFLPFGRPYAETRGIMGGGGVLPFFGAGLFLITPR